MTEKEWLDIGYDKNIIDVQAFEEITFHDVYKQWRWLEVCELI